MDESYTEIMKGIGNEDVRRTWRMRVTKEQFDSYEECAKSQEVEERGPKECDGGRKRRRRYKWRFGLEL